MAIQQIELDETEMELRIAAETREEARAFFRQHFLDAGVAVDEADAEALAAYELRDMGFTDEPVPDPPKRRGRWWLPMLGWFLRRWGG